MQRFTRFRVWFWILVVPIAISSALALHLRKAAMQAEDDRAGRDWQAESARRDSESKADQTAQRERRALEHWKAAERCARATRSMLPASADRPLLIVVTRSACGGRCSLLSEADAVVESHTLEGLKGAWVINSQTNDYLMKRGPAATDSALQRVAIDQCQDLLSLASEEFLLQDARGQLLSAGNTHRIWTRPEGPMAEVRPNAIDTLRQAVQEHL